MRLNYFFFIYTFRKTNFNNLLSKTIEYLDEVSTF